MDRTRWLADAEPRGCLNPWAVTRVVYALLVDIALHLRRPHFPSWHDLLSSRNAKCRRQRSIAVGGVSRHYGRSRRRDAREAAVAKHGDLVSRYCRHGAGSSWRVVGLCERGEVVLPVDELYWMRRSERHWPSTPCVRLMSIGLPHSGAITQTTTKCTI